MSYQVKTEKLINRSAGDVFTALKDGKLFMNCGSSSSTMKIDFRVGGEYRIDFSNHKLTNFGEFLEIIPNKKIVFTWCQSFEAGSKPDTQVAIELFEEGSKTRLTLLHTGFKTQGVADNHSGGWNGGLDDFAAQIENGRLRMVRKYDTSVEKLYATCKNPQSFFAFMGDVARGSVDFKVGGQYRVPTVKGQINGEFLEIVPNQKITLSWLTGCSGPLKNSKVSLIFSQKDSNSASLEVLHDGLMSDDDQRAHRSGWESVTDELRKIVN
ncbi:MAG: SRPBCC family protein [Pseudobdellovibrio sp.]